MRMRCGAIAAAFLIVLLQGVSSVLAQWLPDGKSICTSAGIQDLPRIVSDGAGGSIITWNDKRSGNFDVYAQRINADGYVLWVLNGIEICAASENQVLAEIAPDGGGGAIVTWRDSRSIFYDIYAQRVGSDGVVRWMTDGVAICTAAENQNYPKLVTDGAGGAIITWFDDRGVDYDIYAQRVDGSGIVQWTVDGIAVCTASGWQYHPRIISDDDGGAIITWRDHRGIDSDVYAQKVGPGGAVQWTANGVAICTVSAFPTGQTDPQIVPDDSGGAIVTWEDHRSGNPYIYAQRADTYGNLLWEADGIRINTAESRQDQHGSVPDGAGGAIVVWREIFRSGPDSLNYDIYAQRIDGNGSMLWDSAGVPVCTEPDWQEKPQIAPDGAGGAIIAWGDTSSSVRWDILAQRVDSSGVLQWAADGITVSSKTGWDKMDCYSSLVSDSAGGAFIAWPDSRSGNWDIYAQRVDSTGNTAVTGAGRTPQASALYRNFPNPFNPVTTIRFNLSVTGFVSLKIYDPSGKLVRTLLGENLGGGTHSIDWDGADDEGRPAASGVYFCRLEAGGFGDSVKMILVK